MRRGGGGAGVTQPFPAGGLRGVVSPQRGTGQSPARQMHFGNILLKIGSPPLDPPLYSIIIFHIVWYIY